MARCSGVCIVDQALGWAFRGSWPTQIFLKIFSVGSRGLQMEIRPAPTWGAGGLLWGRRIGSGLGWLAG